MPVVEKDQRLLFQEYILDPSRVVKEVVLDHGITIVDFVRFQCGEEIKVDANPESWWSTQKYWIEKKKTHKQNCCLNDTAESQSVRTWF